MKKQMVILIFAVLIMMGTAVGAQEMQRPAEMTATEFEVAKMVVCEGVENREPVGVAEKFPVTTEKVICFLDARNISADTEIEFVWYINGKEVANVTLPLKEGARWRTFSSKTIAGNTGNWKVELKDSAGNSIKAVTFTVE
ncbi:MAG: DUF2914 domain-containing protein [Nitrospirota bacterium]